MRPFRFGVAVESRIGVGVDHFKADELARVARRAEQLGYSSLMIGDHFVEYESPSIVALSWAAAIAPRLRFGTLVLGNDYRHPAVLAKDAATLDVVSAGRLELGLGAGWLQADYDAIGLRYDEPRVRIDRLAEALKVVKACWKCEPFDFAGEHYVIQSYAARPRPIQVPRPPILVGGGSPRVLRLAGAEADIVGIHPSTAKASVIADTQEERTRRKVEWVREGAGSRFDGLELMTQCDVIVTDDRASAAAPIAAAAEATVEATLSSAAMLVGTIDELCELLQWRREEWGVSYVVLDSGSMEAFAPVVDRLGGH